MSDPPSASSSGFGPGPPGPGPHPGDEALSDYVDGALGPAQREAVHDHLSTCAACRWEVETAVGARAALQRLPDLVTPPLTHPVLPAALRGARAGSAVQGPGAPSRPRRDEATRGRAAWWRRRGLRVGWQAGLAAAAAVVAIAVVATVVGRSVGPRRTTGAAGVPAASPTMAGPKEGAPPLVLAGPDYSPASLRDLASRLAASDAVRSGERVPAPSPSASPPGQPNSLPGAEFPAGGTVLGCLMSGSGVPADARPVHLEAASFEGEPAFVGAFVVPPAATGLPSHLVVAAVSREGCRPLFSVNRTL